MNSEMSDAEQKVVRADLNTEFGHYPATLDPEDIERHRRMNAATARAPDIDEVHRKWTWHREERRRRDAEAQGRAQVADLYDEGSPIS